jgi:hypothetical protein
MSAESIGSVFTDYQKFLEAREAARAHKRQAQQAGQTAMESFKDYVALIESGDEPVIYEVRPLTLHNRLYAATIRDGGLRSGRPIDRQYVEITEDAPFVASSVREGSINLGRDGHARSVDFYTDKTPYQIDSEEKELPPFESDLGTISTHQRLQIPLNNVLGISVVIRKGDHVVAEWPPQQKTPEGV